MASGSDKLSEDQEPYRGSPIMTQSPEVHSNTTDSEFSREETNESAQGLVPKLLDIPGIEDGLSEENASELCVNAETLSDAVMEDQSKGCFAIENDCTTVKDTQAAKIAVQTTNDCKEDSESLKLLTEKLSAALVNVSLKDDLVKQHSKVAEEAVAGWEKAEKESATLKQQLEATMQNKSALETRVSQLDEALKECVRQLRLAKDEQERKINEAVAEKMNELQVAKTRLEDQLAELQALVETSRLNSPDYELQQKVEVLESVNVSLKKELQSILEELEVRTIERDLSTKAAETASKQHLESIKKVARLEAECRKLKSISRVSLPSIEHKSNNSAASCAESLTDNQSDGAEQLSSSEFDSHKMNGSWASALIAELDHIKSDKAVAKIKHSSSKDINLMDDFLEMERLAALPNCGPQVCSDVCEETPEKAVHEADDTLRIELESMRHRNAELEEVISKVEEEKAELAMALGQAQCCLEKSQVQLIESQMKLDQLERELRGANEGEQFHKNQAMSLVREAELLSSQIESLRAEIRKQQALSEENSIRCEELESKLKEKEEELEKQKNAMSNDNQMKEMALIQTQQKLEKSEAELKQVEFRVNELEKELQDAREEKKQEELEKQKNATSNDDLQMKEMALIQIQQKLEKSEAELKQVEMKVNELEKKLQEAREEKNSLNCELDSVREELQKMSSQIDSLIEQLRTERALVTELSTKSKDLEYELLRKTQEFDAQLRAHSNNELKIKQEDLAIAAGKLADCQQTIASLGSQLKSLATLEDFLIDTTSIPGFTPPAPLMARRSAEPWKLHSNDTYLSEKEYEQSIDTQEHLSPFANHNTRNTRGSLASSSSSTSSAYFLNYPSEKNGNGFASYFNLSRS